MTRGRGRLLRALVLGPLLVAGLVPAVGAAAGPISAARPVVAADPCVDRPPTELDRRRDWQSVGLARDTAAGVEPVMGSLTADDARRLDVTRPASYEFGVAVSPDGRPYRQSAPAPVGPPEARSYNPTPPDVDPEGEAGTGAFTPNTVFPPDDRVLRLSTTSYPRNDTAHLGWRRVIAVMAYHGNWGTRVTSTRSSNLCNWIHTFPSAFNDHQCE